MPIGQATGSGYDADGAALWRLIVHGVKIPGRWVIIDRRFVALGDDSAGKRQGPREGGPSGLGETPRSGSRDRIAAGPRGAPEGPATDDNHPQSGCQHGDGSRLGDRR
jgi:hypothetical protein